jgi:hypothetical protein
MDLTNVESWFENFDSSERVTAQSLLRASKVVPTGVLVDALWKEIESEVQSGGPVVALPIRKVKNAPLYPEDLDRDCLVDVLPIAGLNAGSAPVLGNVIREIAKTSSALLVPREELTLAEMRERNISTILLVDDIIGSGRQARTYVDELYRHPTIKSWVSYKKVSIKVVSYMATRRGLQYVGQHARVASARSVMTAPQISELPSREKKDIKSLCTRYCSPEFQQREWTPLGFGDAGTLVFFSHSTPNSNPPITWQAKHANRPGWKPLAENRSGMAAGAIASAAQTRREDLLSGERLRHLRRTKSPVDLIVTLLAISGGMTTLHEISSGVDRSPGSVKNYLATCNELGWVKKEPNNQRFELTAAGMTELKKLLTEPLDG